MILIKGREMLISNREQYLGSTADNNSEVRIFKIDRLRSVDIANLTFKIDLEYANGGKDTCSLEKEVTEESIVLQWKIASELLQIPGPIFANLRATDEIGAVKWSSFCGVFYSEEAINTPGAWEGKLTELEQAEKLVEGYKNSAESAAEEAKESKNEAKAAKETAVSAMNDTISAKSVSMESANAAVKAKTDAEYARDAAQLAKEQTVQIAGAGIATTEKVGLVRPDGETVEVGETGLIKVPKATMEKMGLVRPDGETVEVGETGLIKVPKATTEKMGLVRPDGETIGLESDLLKSLVTAAGLKTNDTNGLLGVENAEVMLQALIDNITNRVVNQILTKTMLVNNALTTVSGQYPADAAYLKTLKDLIDNLTTAVSQLNSEQQKIIRPGANIGGGMCVYTTGTTDKGLTRKFSYPNISGIHDFGFLIIDQNKYADIYAVGMLCGVKTILKTSSEAAPSLSDHILSIPLDSWSSVVLITTEKNVTIN